jgi:hypothetical protein
MLGKKSHRSLSDRLSTHVISSTDRMIWVWSCGALEKMVSWTKFRTQNLPNTISNTRMLFKYCVSTPNVAARTG